jgi:hypothetical protein
VFFIYSNASSGVNHQSLLDMFVALTSKDFKSTCSEVLVESQQENWFSFSVEQSESMFSV